MYFEDLFIMNSQLNGSAKALEWDTTLAGTIKIQAGTTPHGK